ncbi:serine hydroxymethyltransferase [Patescibacteria group bacterium]|nr:serine hydroxymethyltransferase [Patescibacteria group bacterium]
MMKDKEIEKLIREEAARERKVVNLIASENFVSNDVLEALGSVFTNKYAEGYPGGRYYGGTVVADKLENIVRKRALKLFHLSPNEWSVNVQPYSGSPANLAIYLALVPPGEKIMGMSLAMGGHLTHGQKVSVTGKLWNQIPYGVSQKTETLDYAEIAKIAKKERPAIIVTGYTAYPRVIDFGKFRKIADSVGAVLMVDMSHFAGLVAGGAYPTPFKYADVVMATTHKTLRGPRGAMIFSRKIQISNFKFQTNSKFKIKNQKITIAEAIDRAVFPGLQGGPHLNAIAAIGVALREDAKPEFKKYAKQIVKNAKMLAGELKRLGWRIVSGGTDTHLMLVDTMSRGIGGKEAAEKLERAGIIVNKNTIPYDTRKPTDPSGIRIGTPAATTRGMKEKDMKKLAAKIDKILRGK